MFSSDMVALETDWPCRGSRHTCALTPAFAAVAVLVLVDVVVVGAEEVNGTGFPCEKSITVGSDLE